jgi:hypothetical protein
VFIQRLEEIIEVISLTVQEECTVQDRLLVVGGSQMGPVSIMGQVVIGVKGGTLTVQVVIMAQVQMPEKPVRVIAKV